HDVVAELFGVGLGHGIHPSSSACRHRRSDVTDQCSSPGDVVLPKTRHNFFAWTELGPVLRSLRVERLIVAGLQTDVCVEATVRAGLEHNFSVAVAEDAVSTDGPDLHFASLNSMRVIYVEVGTWRELIKPNAPWDRAFRTPQPRSARSLLAERGPEVEVCGKCEMGGGVTTICRRTGVGVPRTILSLWGAAGGAADQLTETDGPQGLDLHALDVRPQRPPWAP
ncbi:cysteine hydrolase family protein, partial [Nocardia salmonicida]|uniref:cysteine hydrolase family protein n=1 Tax=Nocardia salmonicida TaxID=53431 RepID=UPI003CF78C8E